MKGEKHPWKTARSILHSNLTSDELVRTGVPGQAVKWVDRDGPCGICLQFTLKFHLC